MANRSDDFNRANCSDMVAAGEATPSDGGSPWVNAISSWGIFSSKAYGAGGGANTITYLDCGAGAGDGTIQMTIKSSASGAASGFAIRVKISDSSCYFVKVTASQIFLYYFNGTTETLVSGGGGSIAINDVLSVVFTGGTFVCKVNGTTQWTISSGASNNLTEIRHGLYAHADASTTWDDFSFVGGSPATLTQGIPAVVSTSDTTITLLAPNAVGGTSPYTYQWKRATAANGSYSNVGTNSTSLADSSGLVAGTVYWYTITATDSAGSPQTALSVPVPAKLSAKALKTRIIGDSHWATGSPAGGQNAPTEFVARLQAWLLPRVVTAGGNSAFGGAQSGSWIPGAAGTPLEAAVTAANSAGENLYVIELGSNDSTNGGNTPVTAATYASNMALIINYIKANATGTPLTIAVLYPFYYYQPSGTPVGFDLPTSLNALWSYRAKIDALNDNVTVFSVGIATGYQIPTAGATYLYTDLLHLSFTAGQNLSADLAAMDLAGRLQFAGTGTAAGILFKQNLGGP